MVFQERLVFQIHVRTVLLHFQNLGSCHPFSLLVNVDLISFLFQARDGEKWKCRLNSMPLQTCTKSSKLSLSNHLLGSIGSKLFGATIAKLTRFIFYYSQII